MTDSTAETARLKKVAQAIGNELERQGVADALADLGFNVMDLARVVIRAADGDVIPFGGKAAGMIERVKISKAPEAVPKSRRDKVEPRRRRVFLLR